MLPQGFVTRGLRASVGGQPLLLRPSPRSRDVANERPERNDRVWQVFLKFRSFLVGTEDPRRSPKLMETPKPMETPKFMEAL